MQILQSLNNQLTALRMAFDEAMMKGHSFQDVKKIYLQIKEIEKKIAERQIELLKPIIPNKGHVSCHYKDSPIKPHC